MKIVPYIICCKYFCFRLPRLDVKSTWSWFCGWRRVGVPIHFSPHGQPVHPRLFEKRPPLLCLSLLPCCLSLRHLLTLLDDCFFILSFNISKSESSKSGLLQDCPDCPWPLVFLYKFEISSSVSIRRLLKFFCYLIESRDRFGEDWHVDNAYVLKGRKW